MRWLVTIGLLSLLLSSGCATPRPSPDCGVAEKETRTYMLQYLDALEENGLLRQQLKACAERR